MSTKLAVLTFIWLICLGLGVGFLTFYSNTPGQEAEYLSVWPDSSSIQRSESKATLMMFLHPRCSCSSASLSELERLLPFLKDQVQLVIVFTQPKGKTGEWTKERLWKKAISLPEAQVLVDSDGKETDLFGAKTSGHTFLYDHFDRILFTGGLTLGRGHEGDSRGRRLLLAWAKGEINQVHLSRVYGCALKEGNFNREISSIFEDM